MYQFKELYTLDFSKVNYINEVHQIIKDELGFPDHYGMNWSAFWDCLTDMVGDPIHIEIVRMERVQSKLRSCAATKAFPSTGSTPPISFLNHCLTNGS